MRHSVNFYFAYVEFDLHALKFKLNVTQAILFAKQRI